MNQRRTRKNTPPVKVYCLPEERTQLQASASAARKSLSTYLLNVGLGYPVRNILDQRCVEDLLRVNADMGRLGGLLKLWLTNDERTAAFSESTIRALLAKIEATQDELLDVVRAVLTPRDGCERF
ncbi:conjugal transfer transcriptional regulator TraJ [Massilia sp. CT11-137]|uniref:conjugal transfer transcriptional regulator TraJ n=1 Tax=Massilia sp. CT11-137 TaxID=3393901 RepID=UPI0039AFBE9B